MITVDGIDYSESLKAALWRIKAKVQKAKYDIDNPKLPPKQKINTRLCEAECTITRHKARSGMIKSSNLS